jgi:hypothetical protein
MPVPPPSASFGAPEPADGLEMKVHMDAGRTVVELGRAAIAFTGSLDPSTPSPPFACRAASRLLRGGPSLSAPMIYFADLDHARRAIGGPDEHWSAPAPLVRQQVCKFQLARTGTTLPVPAGAPVHLVSLDHVIKLAECWYQLLLDSR